MRPLLEDKELRKHVSPGSAEVGLRKVPGPLNELRQRDRAKHNALLVSFLFEDGKRWHPYGSEGWWCSYEEYMFDLIPFLSEKDSHDPESWLEFRKQVSAQLSCCRQCAITYHRAVGVWERQRGEKQRGLRDDTRRRTEQLLKWDVSRLIPCFEAGAISSSRGEDAVTTSARTRCRDAFLESLLCRRLCKRTDIRGAITRIFRKWSPVKTDQEVMPFIRQNESLPAGLAVLCFYPSLAVREWALRFVKYARSSSLSFSSVTLTPFVDEIFHSLYIRATKKSTPISEEDSGWAPDFSSSWDSLNTVLRATIPRELCNVMKCTKISAAKLFFATVSTSERISIRESCHVMRFLLQAIPCSFIFIGQVLTPERFLHAIFRRIMDTPCSDDDCRLLLDIFLYLTSAVLREGEKMDSASLFQKCFGFFEKMEAVSGMNSQVPSHLRSVRNDILALGANLLGRFYHGLSQQMLLNPDRISKSVIVILKEISYRESSWVLLRSVLLTDAFNLLKGIYDESDFHQIADTFLKGSQERAEGEFVSDVVLNDIVHAARKSPVTSAWLGTLWDYLERVSVGEGFGKSSANLSEVEMGLLCELHLLVGFLDSKAWGVMKTEDATQMRLRERGRMVSSRLFMIQEVLWKWLERCSKEYDGKLRYKLLPSDVPHLLSSARKETENATRTLFRKQHNSMQKAKFAGLQSKDKFMMHFLTQNDDDSWLLRHGFRTALQMISAQRSLVTVRTFPSVVRLLCLLVSNDQHLSYDSSLADAALRMFLTFLEEWKLYESLVDATGFREVICRLFAEIPTLWNALFTAGSHVEQKKRPHSSETKPLLRKAVKHLFGMHSMKDEIARKAWIRVITNKQFDNLVNSSGVCEDAILEVSRHFGTVKEADQMLPRMRSDDRRLRNCQQSRNERLRSKGATIDDFFPPDRRGVAYCGESSRPFSVSTSDQQRSQKVMVLPKTAPKGQAMKKQGNSKASLSDIRRDHSHARSEFRRKIRKMGMGTQEPTKTRFELVREMNLAAKEMKSFSVPPRYRKPGQPRIPTQDTLPHRSKARRIPSEEAIGSPLEEIQSTGRECFEYPVALRGVQTRSIERIKRDVLTRKHPFDFEDERYLNLHPRSFESIEAYINYWEPLVIVEFRAGLHKKMNEEKAFAAGNKHGTIYKGYEKTFEVDGPVEDVGYLHTVSMTSREQSSKKAPTPPSCGSSPSNIATLQLSDIVLVKISKPTHMSTDTHTPESESCLGIVTNIFRKNTEFKLTLSIVLDNKSSPGKGRSVKVSKLATFTTLQRQLDALWALPKVPDGILWSLLNPMEGWRLKDETKKLNKGAADQQCMSPLRLLKGIEDQGILNTSQANAIKDVVRSCHRLFGSDDCNSSLRRGSICSGISLIQGPPGTGKTSTIISLLSVLLSNQGRSLFQRRKAVRLGSSTDTAQFPSVRILVCAPSNAAVDELMLRVMNDGLFMKSGARASPRIVRVGRGATIESLKKLEISTIVGSERRNLSGLESTSRRKADNRQREIDKVSNRIEELDNTLKMAVTRMDASRGSKGKDHGDLQTHAKFLENLNETLRVLHEKKRLLCSMRLEDQIRRKENEKSRKQEEMKIAFQSFAAASVVFATLSSSGHEDLRTFGLPFDVVIVDEAAQSCEPETLIPLTVDLDAALKKGVFKQVVLVGDPKQLPATVLSQNHLVSKAVGRSLFERLGSSESNVVHLLDTQYRMHPHISLFPSQRFYAGRVVNGNSIEGSSMKRAWHEDKERRFGPLTFFDTTETLSRESRSQGGSLCNRQEASLVVDALKALLVIYGEEHLQRRIAVLSPYKHQVELLKAMISEAKELEPALIEVSTIDGIQGREKSVVILSTVRSGHSKDIGFVKDDRRLNVALTRAKHSLMIFGHSRFLSSHSESWALLTSHCRHHSRVLRVGRSSSRMFPESQKNFKIVARRPKARGDNFVPNGQSSSITDDSISVYNGFINQNTPPSRRKADREIKRAVDEPNDVCREQQMALDSAKKESTFGAHCEQGLDGSDRAKTRGDLSSSAFRNKDAQIPSQKGSDASERTLKRRNNISHLTALKRSNPKRSCAPGRVDQPRGLSCHEHIRQGTEKARTSGEISYSCDKYVDDGTFARSSRTELVHNKGGIHNAGLVKHRADSPTLSKRVSFPRQRRPNDRQPRDEMIHRKEREGAWTPGESSNRSHIADEGSGSLKRMYSHRSFSHERPSKMARCEQWNAGETTKKPELSGPSQHQRRRSDDIHFSQRRQSDVITRICGRMQRSERLIAHKEEKNGRNRASQTRTQPENKSRGQSVVRPRSVFSLADSQTKLNGTLRAVRESRL